MRVVTDDAITVVATEAASSDTRLSAEANEAVVVDVSHPPRDDTVNGAVDAVDTDTTVELTAAEGGPPSEPSPANDDERSSPEQADDDERSASTTNPATRITRSVVLASLPSRRRRFEVVVLLLPPLRMASLLVSVSRTLP